MLADGDRVLLESRWEQAPAGEVDGAGPSGQVLLVAQVLERVDGGFVTTGHYVDARPQVAQPVSGREPSGATAS